MKTVHINELLFQKNYEGVENYINKVSEELVKSIIRRNYDNIANIRLTVEALKGKLIVAKQSLEFLKDGEDKDMFAVINLLGRINECSLIVETFAREDILYSTLEELEDIEYSYLFLNKVKESPEMKISVEDLSEKIREENPTKVDENMIEYAIYKLDDLGLTRVEDEVISLTEKGKSMFDIYSANKKYTNKYEKIRRKTSYQQRIKVDYELLDKMERIPNGFNLLQVMYDHSNEIMPVPRIADFITLEEEEIKNILDRLVHLRLVKVTQVEDGVEYFSISKYGKNIFTLYREDKRYTNKYESIQRKEKKNIA